MSKQGRGYYSPPLDNALREAKRAVAKARSFGANERDVINFLLLGYRGLSLGGEDEKRLTSILAGIWADAEDQRDEASDD